MTTYDDAKSTPPPDGPADRCDGCKRMYDEKDLTFWQDPICPFVPRLLCPECLRQYEERLGIK